MTTDQTTHSPPRRRGVILIVDDDQLLATALARMLGRQHEVVVINDPRTAAALLTIGATYDLVLCDLMMPDMTGMDLHRHLEREAPAVADRLVFMTGGACTPGAQAFVDTVANPVLTKPIDAASVTALLRAREAAGAQQERR
jgi:CheY-like chemotaxis protein